MLLEANMHRIRGVQVGYQLLLRHQTQLPLVSSRQGEERGEWLLGRGDKGVRTHADVGPIPLSGEADSGNGDKLDVLVDSSSSE